MTTKEAMEHVCEALRTDDGYYYSWQANIAMQFQDAMSRAGHKFPDLHKISNEAAKEFLDLLLRLP